MKNILFISILSLGLLACELPKSNSNETPGEKPATNTEVDNTQTEKSQNNSTEEQKTESTDDFSLDEKFKNAAINKTYGNCSKSDGPCARVVVDYPNYEGSNARYINKQIDKKLTDILSNYLPNTKVRTSDPNKVADLILEDYEKFIKEYNDVSERWDINLKAEISHISGNILTVAIEEYAYTGGAHGSSSLTYVNYNWQSKKELSGKDLISNWKKLTKIAEEKFRKDKGYKPNENLSKKGYFFEDGKFELTDNIGLTKEGLDIYFNSYEIAPYAMGPTSIKIPYAQISDILKD